MKENWTQTLNDLQSELSPHVYNTWLKPLHFCGIKDHSVVLEVPNAFYRDRLQSEFADLIRTRMRKITAQNDLTVTFVVAENGSSQKVNALMPSVSSSNASIAAPIPTMNVSRDHQNKISSLDGVCEKFTFSSFIVGNSNQFAHAAALAVSEAPGKTYNPLFIYGGVGLGKTHLLCAVGNEAIRKGSGKRVVYRTAEQFMNELINSIRYEKTEAFRTRYRESCDILLLDDIQFLSCKERTQEEFFHTFNALQSANKQIVLTSDKMPKDIPDLDERLRSRFQSGLFCDIQPPDVETRIAILKKKAESDRLELPDDAAMFLAKNIRSNVRELEGALIRLGAFSSISGQSITLDLAKQVFGSLAIKESRISVEEVQKCVAEFFSLGVSDLKSARRHKVVALPRQIAMYLARKLTSLSFPELGSRFGGKDHTTVMHAVQKIERLIENDSPLRKTITTIENTLVG